MSRTHRAVPAAFIGAAVLAGGNAVCIRFSNRELAPLWGAGLRFLLAGTLMLGLMAALRLPFPRGRALAGALLYGVVGFGGAFGLAYYALQHVQAGFGQTLLALVPLATLLLAVLQRQERLRLVALAGTVLSLGGIAVMTGGGVRSSVPLLALLAILGSVVCFAEAGIIVRGFPPLHPIVMNAIGMGAGAVGLIAASLIAGERIVIPRRPPTWIALAYIVPIGSAVVFGLNLVVLRYWTASRVAYGFVLIPIVTITLSSWLDNEPVTWKLVGGGLLVLAGVYIGALRRSDGTQSAEQGATPATRTGA